MIILGIFASLDGLVIRILFNNKPNLKSFRLKNIQNNSLLSQQCYIFLQEIYTADYMMWMILLEWCNSDEYSARTLMYAPKNF